MMDGINGIVDVRGYLNLFEKCPSEHAKMVFIKEKMVPWIEKKGTPIIIRSEIRRNVKRIGADAL